jgi:hypothetical protein
MLITIKGVYDNGKIVLEEKPNIEKTNVLVTLLETTDTKKSGQRVFGTLKGKIKIHDDFDAPLVELKEYM